MIRKAKAEDLADINKIGVEYNPNFIKLFHIDTELDNNLAIVLVDVTNDIVNGFLYALDFGDNIDLLYIIVDESKRNNQIGSKLMKYFVDNYQVINKTITLEVAINNDAAINLYKKFNFYEVNKRKGYYHGVDALVMRRD